MAEGASAATEYPSTTAGLQAAIDSLAGAKGKVFIGPGTLETTTAIWLHSGTHLQGSGRTATVIKRASGTIANGDSDQSATVICSSAYGANGTVSSSSSTLSDILVSDITIDGNQSAFTALTDTTLTPSGIYVNYIDGLRINGVRVQNTLGSGFVIRYCRNASIVDVETDTVGQWSQVAGKNGISMEGDYAATGNWGYNYSLNGARIFNTGIATSGQDAEAIYLSGVFQASVSNVVVDDCDFLFECSPGNITNGTWGNWVISNITATNVLGYFFTWSLGQSSGYTCNNVAISNCTIDGHATLHQGGVIAMAPSSSAITLNNFTVSNCVFRNINSKDDTTHHWVDLQPTNSAGYAGFSISNCKFYGLSSSVRTGNERGINIRGTVTDVHLSDLLLKDVPGHGVGFNDNSSVTVAMSRCRVRNVIVDGANGSGFIISSTASSTGVLSEIRFDGCLAKDTNKQTSGSGFWITCNQATATISGVTYSGCRAYKTSGTNMTHGFLVTRSNGTLDNITVIDCDWSGTVNGTMYYDAGVTNSHFTPRPGLGTAISAAATIQMPQNGDVFHVTGNTNITNGITVNPWDNGRTVTLIFEGTPTVSDTGTSKLAGNFVAAGTTNDYDTLTLVCDGTNWTEVARSTN